MVGPANVGYLGLSFGGSSGMASGATMIESPQLCGGSTTLALKTSVGQSTPGGYTGSGSLSATTSVADGDVVGWTATVASSALNTAEGASTSFWYAYRTGTTSCGFSAGKHTSRGSVGSVVLAPAAAPTPAPTDAPTPAPTGAPTPAPTEAQTLAPTEAQTPAPTEAPTSASAGAQTPAPTETSTPAPTDAPVAPYVTVVTIQVSDLDASTLSSDRALSCWAATSLFEVAACGGADAPSSFLDGCLTGEGACAAVAGCDDPNDCVEAKLASSTSGRRLAVAGEIDASYTAPSQAAAEEARKAAEALTGGAATDATALGLESATGLVATGSASSAVTVLPASAGRTGAAAAAVAAVAAALVLAL